MKTRPFTLQARRADTCASATCRAPIKPGDRILWDPADRRAYCPACTRSHEARIAADDDDARTMYGGATSWEG